MTGTTAGSRTTPSPPLRSGRGATIALLLALVLTACTQAPTAPAEDTPFTIPFGDGSAEVTSGVPEGFPSTIPLVDGDVTRGITASDDSGTAYGVFVDSSVADPTDIINGQLSDAGFAVSETVGPEGTMVFESEEWQVSVTVNPDGAPVGTVLYLATLAKTD